MRNFIGSRVLPRMIYHRPKNIREAFQLLNARKGEWKVIAGCTDFIPAIRRGTWSFEEGLNLIDIKGVKELNFIKKERNKIRIGAATRLSDLVRSSLIQEQAPILANAINEMASLQIRNSGTIGGNLCTASPAADTAPPLLVLDAKVKVRGMDREELFPLTKFFLGPGKTVIRPREILNEIEFPVMKPDEKSCWIKMGRRDTFTLSVISVATWVRVKDGVFKAVRIALGAVAPTPIRAWKAEEYLMGKKTTSEVIEEGARIVATEVRPISDVRASAEYRKDMAHVLTKRGLMACLK